MEKSGTVYWICGLAGSGKTAIAEKFSKKLKQKKELIPFYLMVIILEKVLSQKIISMKRKIKVS